MTEKTLTFPDRRICWITAALFAIIIIGWYSHEFGSLWFQLSKRSCSSHYMHQLNQENVIRSRLNESELAWTEGVALRRKTELETPVPVDDPWTIATYRTIWDFFYANFNCPNLVERLGRAGDGGKWVCGISQLDKLGKSCVVYSFGISTDITFEQDVLDRTNCSLHAYDYTVKPSRVPLAKLYPRRATFSSLGLGPQNIGSLRTLKTEMDQRGHKFIDVLKVDIEGGEFQSMDQILKDFPNGLPFGQLLVELHLGRLPRKGMYERFKNWWEALEAGGLRAFHSEPNLYAFSPKRIKPRFYEMSFLNVRIDHAVLHA